jgi:hypothetical protein
MGDDNAEIDVTELVAALLLGLAAVTIAWSTYQSALWGGQQDEAYTESVREANNAVDLLQAADTIRTLDQSLFVGVLTSGVCDEGEQGDEVACEQVLANMSDEGAAAVDEWLISSESKPFESPAYLDTLYGQGEDAKLVSEQFFEEAGEANENGDNYELASAILTTVLFLAGISVVLDDGRIRWALLGAASLLLIGATTYVVSLPLA